MEAQEMIDLAVKHGNVNEKEAKERLRDILAQGPHSPHWDFYANLVFSHMGMENLDQARKK